MNKRGLVPGYDMKFLLCDVSKTFTETISRPCETNGTLWMQIIHTLSLAGRSKLFNFILKQIAVLLGFV